MRFTLAMRSRGLTMRLSDAGLLHQRQTKALIYPNHRLPPWLTEDAAPDRSNRLLDETTMMSPQRLAAHFGVKVTPIVLSKFP